MQGLIDLEFEVDLTGFSLAEIDGVLDDAREASLEGTDTPDDVVPAVSGPAVTRQGDCWLMRHHRLVCGDAQDASVFARLMGDERADRVFTDPPYNVKIDGHVCGKGNVRHRELATHLGRRP